MVAAQTAARAAAAGLTLHFKLYEPLLNGAFTVFLLAIGFTAIHWIANRQAEWRSVNSLPTRSTSRAEWGLGTTLGWALALAAILPAALSGALKPTFWFQPRAFLVLLLSLAVLLLSTLASELIFRGYLFTRLIRIVGPTLATLLLSVVYAIVSGFRLAIDGGNLTLFHPYATPLSVFTTFLLGILLSMAYLRTHALWLSWGIHFAWAASTALLFGLPISGDTTYAAIVGTSTYGTTWLTGGPYGPEAALLTPVIIILGMFALFRLTGDLAWQYTQPTIVAAGYPMDVAPPAEHTRMEQAAAAVPAPLVQILATTPSAPSTNPVIETHLRSNDSQATSE